MGSYSTTISTRRAFADQASKSNQKSPDWPKIWFAKLCRFHKRPVDSQWEFNPQHVVEFLKSRHNSGSPAWKRLKAAEALIQFREQHPTPGEIPDLQFIVEKLSQLAAVERKQSASGADGNGRRQRQSPRSPDQPEPNDEPVGWINPRESEPIQAMRIKLRLMGRADNTETAYIKWLRRFLRSMNVRTFEQCSNICKDHVVAFLTDLVVDGDVAPSTQDQAFYSLFDEDRPVLSPLDLLTKSTTRQPPETIQKNSNFSDSSLADPLAVTPTKDERTNSAATKSIPTHLKSPAELIVLVSPAEPQSMCQVGNAQLSTHARWSWRTLTALPSRLGHISNSFGLALWRHN